MKEGWSTVSLGEIDYETQYTHQQLLKSSDLRDLRQDCYGSDDPDPNADDRKKEESKHDVRLSGMSLWTYPNHHRYHKHIKKTMKDALVKKRQYPCHMQRVYHKDRFLFGGVWEMKEATTDDAKKLMMVVRTCLEFSLNITNASDETRRPEVHAAERSCKINSIECTQVLITTNVECTWSHACTIARSISCRTDFKPVNRWIPGMDKASSSTADDFVDIPIVYNYVVEPCHICHGRSTYYKACDKCRTTGGLVQKTPFMPSLKLTTEPDPVVVNPSSLVIKPFMMCWLSSKLDLVLHMVKYMDGDPAPDAIAGIPANPRASRTVLDDISRTIWPDDPCDMRRNIFKQLQKFIRQQFLSPHHGDRWSQLRILRIEARAHVSRRSVHIQDSSVYVGARRAFVEVGGLGSTTCPYGENHTKPRTIWFEITTNNTGSSPVLKMRCTPKCEKITCIYERTIPKWYADSLFQIDDLCTVSRCTHCHPGGRLHITTPQSLSKRTFAMLASSTSSSSAAAAPAPKRFRL